LFMAPIPLPNFLPAKNIRIMNESILTEADIQIKSIKETPLPKGSPFEARLWKVV